MPLYEPGDYVKVEFPDETTGIGEWMWGRVSRPDDANSRLRCPRVEDAVYKALRPMLAVGGGDLWLLTTPNGRWGFFYENWASGSDDWTRVAMPACRRV